MNEYHYLFLLSLSILGSVWGTQKKFFKLALLSLILSPLSFYLGCICFAGVSISLTNAGVLFMVSALFFIGLAGLLFIKYYLIDKKES